MTTGRGPASQQGGSGTSGRGRGTGGGSSGSKPAGGSAKRQRLLAPLPLGKTAAAPRGGAAAYTEPGPGALQLPGGTGRVEYRPHLLPPPTAAALFEQLRRELPWEQRSVRVMGRTVPQPRLIAYQADGAELQYTYSGTTLQPAPWHPAIAALKQQVEAAAGATFNSCLLNLYRSGADSISWHSDNEPLYGNDPTIASVSLGEPREFLLRQNTDHSYKYRYRLGGGALLVMAGSMQRHWMHSVPRRATLVGERISLTFRTILRPEAQRSGGGGGDSG